MDSQILLPIRIVATAACVMVLVIIQYSAADAFQLTSRQPWMDEIHTLELVSDPDTGHMLDALADGADFNPPGYYLISRAVVAFADSTEPRILRTFSLLCVVAGLIAIGLSLQRHVRFVVSIAVVAGLLAQTLLVDQSLEARFYAPWFAALAWLCFCIERERQTVLTIAASCLLAIVVCCVHYFGIISLGLVIAGLVVRRPQSYRNPAVWMPLCCGLLAIGLCYPFYVGQRAALTIATWISAPNIDRIQGFFMKLIPTAAFGLAIFAAVAQWVMTNNSDEVQDDFQDEDHNDAIIKHPSLSQPVLSRPLLPQYAGSLSLLLLPVVLLIFSLTVQPALVPRYSLVFLIGCAPLFAWLLANVRLQLLAPVGLCFLVLGIIRTSGLREQLVQLDQSRIAMLEQLNEHAEGMPVAFENRIESFPMVRLAGDESSNWYLVDFDTDSLAKPSALRVVQRDVARRFAKWYPKYKTAPLHELRVRERFFVVPYPDGTTDDIDYGPFESSQVADRLYEMQRF